MSYRCLATEAARQRPDLRSRHPPRSVPKRSATRLGLVLRELHLERRLLMNQADRRTNSLSLSTLRHRRVTPPVPRQHGPIIADAGRRRRAGRRVAAVCGEGSLPTGSAAEAPSGAAVPFADLEDQTRPSSGRLPQVVRSRTSTAGCQVSMNPGVRPPCTSAVSGALAPISERLGRGALRGGAPT